MTNDVLTALAENPNITKPAFKKNAIVILTVDYTESECNNNLIENAICTVNKCGCSKYPIIVEAGNTTLSKITDGEEWCFISVETDDFDLYEDQGCVRAKDLKLVRTSLIKQTQ